MDVSPLNYKLTFEPDLKKFTFNGMESVTVDCKKSTNLITMHCAELKIVSCQVKSKGKIIKSSPKINEKKETIKVKDKPPHAPVSTHSSPKEPPEIK